MIKILFKWLFFPFTNFSWYKIVAIIGFFIRLLLLPNPFELLNTVEPLTGPEWKLILGFADYFIITPILYYISYGTVGIMYERGSRPVFGSILYTVFYSSYVAIIYILLFATQLLLTAICVFVFIFIFAFAISKALDTL